ncbi:MAG: epoxide hydrolase [Alphaproteobacteria bacterium]|nr:epoxide hydrolase [Alphaproteobacteria bacterium]
MPRPFTISFSDAEIGDLKARLVSTRFPESLEGVGWEYGMESDFLRRFAAYWANEFDWEAAQARLNGFEHFLEDVDGETIHFVHARGRGQVNVPILLTNGWPSNFVELLPLVPLLTEPIDGVAFDVVIPSLPGYGYSSQPTRPGMNLSRIAPLWAELMTRLGYSKFLISGSDMGAGTEMALVRDFPERLLGAHYINVYFGFERPADPSPEEQAYFGAMDYWSFAEGAYAMVHGTKPATLAVGLNDSPAGLASWVLEKFHKWGDTKGDVLAAFSLDDLCTILSVYWFTQTIGSSVRLYKEAFADADLPRKAPKHDVPHAVLLLPSDMPAPRAWGERNLWNIVRWTELDRGGHFPALEVPQQMADDIRAFHGQIR